MPVQRKNDDTEKRRDVYLLNYRNRLTHGYLRRKTKAECGPSVLSDQ